MDKDKRFKLLSFDRLGKIILQYKIKYYDYPVPRYTKLNLFTERSLVSEEDLDLMIFLCETRLLIN